jgi:AcrR family transcriptional regulator
VPRLWKETIDEHRRVVRDAILEAATRLVARDGLRSVTMSQIAEEAGVGRATLYKYFPDVEAILLVWHEDQLASHLEQLTEVRSRAADPMARLEVVLETYALLSREAREHHDSELAAVLHRHHQVAAAKQRVTDMVEELVTDGVAAGELRDDVDPSELANYCLHALAAAASLPSRAAVRRLVAVTLSGLRKPDPPSRAAC